MAKFYLVDHSLRETGGHHFDYVQCIARAASEMGFETLVGAHRSYRDEQLNNVKSVFRNTTYQPDSYLAGLRHLTRRKVDFLQPESADSNWFRRLKFGLDYRRHKKRRTQFVDRFASDCDQFFRDEKFSEGDHVFFTTVSELELLGLAKYLASRPNSLQAHWHLQFHFNLFEGRTPEYEKQFAVAKSISNCFDIAAAQMPYHRSHFYTTSELLAEQYQRLNVGEFEVLPYPVSDSFRPEPHRDQSVRFDEGIQKKGEKPLRFTFPGAIRREKGHIEYLQPLVNKIWEQHLSKGKMQLVIQRPRRNLVQGEKIELEFPGSVAADANEVVDYLPHPLPSEQYSDLIRSTDCGLLFYDSRTYYSRRAGVMGELLSCGKPVIVSAGSWLAEQIKEANFRHVESLAKSPLASRRLKLTDLEWDSSNVPLPGGVISFNDRRTPFDMKFELQEDEAGFCVFWDWHWPVDNGVFSRLEMYDGSEGDSPLIVQTIGHRNRKSACAYFRVSGSQKKVGLRFLNAFHHSMASVRNLQVVSIQRSESELPLGSVGIVAADEMQLPNCIDEMVRHYDHYRSSAEQFAHSWYSRHQPKRTIAHLMSVEGRGEMRRAA